MGLSSFLPGILLLGIVIFFHELGHFLAAKWRRVTVLKFSLGMGPELFGFTRGGTRYCVSWIPLGGFVQMAGDHLAEDGSMPEGGPEQFLTHPWYGRIAIAVAGLWLLTSARSRSGKPMYERLAAELMDAYNNTGNTIKRKEDVQRMAEANRAFSHYGRF